MIKIIQNMVFIFLCCFASAQAQIKLGPTIKIETSLSDYMKSVEKDVKNFTDEESYEKKSWIDGNKKPVKFSELNKVEQKIFTIWQYETAGYKLLFHEATAPSLFADKAKQEMAVKNVLELRKSHALKFEKRIETLLANDKDIPSSEVASYLNRVKIYHDKYKLIERKNEPK